MQVTEAMFRYKFPRWDLILWCVFILGMFVLEFLGIFRQQDATLTELIRQTLPRWLRAMVCGWLLYHFVIVQ